MRTFPFLIRISGYHARIKMKDSEAEIAVRSPIDDIPCVHSIFITGKRVGASQFVRTAALRLSLIPPSGSKPNRRERARQSRRGLQPRTGERSEAAGRTIWVCGSRPLRAIAPPAPILPCEVANLAYFGAPPLVRSLVEDGVTPKPATAYAEAKGVRMRPGNCVSTLPEIEMRAKRVKCWLPACVQAHAGDCPVPESA